MRGLIFLFFFPLFLYAEKIASEHSEERNSSASGLALAFQYYKQGDFEKSLKLSDQYLKSDAKGKNSAKLLYIYVTSENSLYKINLRLREYLKLNASLLYNPDHSSLIYLSVYKTMERALVMGNKSIGIQWGKFFKERAVDQKFYGNGLHLYACILHSHHQKKELLILINYALKQDLEERLIDKFNQLKKH